MADPHESRGVVDRAMLRPSPFNPRKSFPEASLRELADSFREHGVLQPLLVRPVGAKVRFDPKKGWSGHDHFEVVFGHRRLAAAELAGVAQLPVTVRQLSDQEVREIQLIENVHREGVPPSEEAEGFRELVALVGQEEAAKRTGTPLQRVRDLVRLADLPAWFLAAVDAGRVGVSTAAVVAKVPGERARKRAAFLVATGHLPMETLSGGEVERMDWTDDPIPNPTGEYTPLSFRDTKYLISRHFTRQLSKGTPFNRKSLDLVPDAGSCDDCPKRAGNDPELVTEGARADMCTDPECFERKLAAYREQEVAKAAKKHGAKPAADLDWPRYLDCPKGWCLLAGPVGESELNADDGWTGKKAEQVVGDLIATWPAEKAVAFHPTTGKPAILVRTKHARLALEAAGLMRKPERAKKEKAPLSPNGGGPKEPDGPYRLYRVTLHPDVMPAVEFDALEGTNEEDLREQAASAFMDWFDGVDWSDSKLIPRSFVTYEPVPAAELEQPVPPESQAGMPAALDPVGQAAEIEHPNFPFAKPGDVVRTSYGTGPYVVRSIDRDKNLLRDGYPTFSLTLSGPDGEKKPSFLNNYQRQADGRITATNGDELKVLPAGSDPGPTYWDWCPDAADRLDGDLQRRWMNGESPFTAGASVRTPVGPASLAQAIKGEPIEGFGLTPAKLNAASASGDLKGKKSMEAKDPFRVPHIEINGRPHVIVFNGEHFPGPGQTWDLRPVWPPDVARNRAIAPSHSDPLEGLRVEIKLTAGGSTHWNEHVVGSKGETRRLIHVPKAKVATKKKGKVKA